MEKKKYVYAKPQNSFERVLMPETWIHHPDNPNNPETVNKKKQGTEETADLKTLEECLDIAAVKHGHISYKHALDKLTMAFIGATTIDMVFVEAAELYASSKQSSEWIRATPESMPDEYTRAVVYKVDVALMCYGIAVFNGKQWITDGTFLSESDFERLSDKPLKGITHYIPLQPPTK